MSWQDELRLLDSALASGQISADQYRQRRDGILAAASGQQEPVTQPPAEPPRAEPPQPAPPAPEQTRTPFPEPFRWTPANPGNSEATQVVRRAGDQPAGESADRTQVVRGTTDAERTQVMPAVTSADPSAERTQTVRGVGQGGQQAPGQWHTLPPQGQGGGDFAPPWGSGTDMPELGFPQWIRQGPEVFEARSGRTRRVILIVAAVIVVLAGGGVAAYFISTSNHATAGPAPKPPVSTTHPTPTPPPGPKLPSGPFVALPGKELVNMSWSITEAVTANVPTQQEVGILQSNGIKTVSALITDDNGIHEGIWAFAPARGSDASAALTAINQLYTEAGYQAMQNAPAGVHAMTLAGNSSVSATYRAHYLTTKGIFVRVEVYGMTPGVASDVLQQEFLNVMQQETTKFPPTGQ